MTTCKTWCLLRGFAVLRTAGYSVLSMQACGRVSCARECNGMRTAHFLSSLHHSNQLGVWLHSYFEHRDNVLVLDTCGIIFLWNSWYETWWMKSCSVCNKKISPRHILLDLFWKYVLYVDSMCIKARKSGKCTGAWKIRIGEINIDMNLMEFSLSKLNWVRTRHHMCLFIPFSSYWLGKYLCWEILNFQVAGSARSSSIFKKLSSSMGHSPLSVRLFLCLLSASVWAALCSSPYLRVIACVSFFFICSPGLVLCPYREVPDLILRSAATSLLKHCQFNVVWRRKGGLYLIFSRFLASLTLHRGRQVGHRVMLWKFILSFQRPYCFQSN